MSSRASSRPTPTSRPARCARCSAAPITWKSPPTARAPPPASIWPAARPCTSPAARDTISGHFGRAGLAGLAGQAGIVGSIFPVPTRPAHQARPTRETYLTMIDFSLNEEHHLLEQSIREWGAQNVAPFIRENERKHHFDRERIIGGMAKLGLLGISVPQEYGGAGMDYISLGVASEELEYLDTSLRVKIGRA